MRAEHAAWAILHRSHNQLDGKREWFEGDPESPCRHRLFGTRAAARVYVSERYGYIAKRPDLRAEPFGWKMPQVVRVRVIVGPA